jgi:hypothetical protein
MGFYWHTFSAGFAACSRGTEAIRLYNAQSPDEYFIVTGTVLQTAVHCKSRRVPDLSGPAIRAFEGDRYVFPVDLKWTMVFTHHDPHIGPFFAEAKAVAIQ